MHWNKVLEYLHNPLKIVNYLDARGGLKLLPDKLYLRLKYFSCLGKKLNLKNPTTFNEKLQWLKLYDRNPIYTRMVDKYEVRQYIAMTIGEDYLIPLLGVWDKFEDIDFSQLPNQFVLKCTHDSGGLVICKDKTKLNIEATRMKINRCLKRNYFLYGREWPYKNVKPRILCEKYMVDESGLELKDYKISCFNDKAKFTEVCLNRNSPSGLNIDMFDTDWNPILALSGHPNSGTMVPKPKNLNKMLEFAEKLSKDIPYLRVDFYEPGGQLFFGELTFYPASGFEDYTPESYNYLLGSWIDIPVVNKSSRRI